MLGPDQLWPQILLQLALILLTALFSGAEAAIPALGEGSLRRRAEEGDKKAALLAEIAHTPEPLLSAIRVCATLTGFLAAGFAVRAFAGPISAAVCRRFALEGAGAGGAEILSAVAVALVLAYFTLVLGVLVPRGAALQAPERAARITLGPVRTLTGLFRPFLWLLKGSARGVLRLLRLDPDAEPEEVSEEEIRMMVDIGEEKGTIESGEKEMIENIFEFNNTTAEDVMLHRTDVVMIPVDEADEEIARTIVESGLSRFPVYEEDADDVVGILNSRDYFLNARRERPLPLRQLLRPAYFVPESVHTDVLFRDMQAKKVHLAVVVDEYGGTSGIITMEDLLEEIVGNIYDEFDPQDEQEIIPLGEDRWRIAGSAALEDVAEALGVELPEDEEYGTLGGLVFAQLAVIPEDGSRPLVEVDGLRIQVEELSERRVEWAIVTKSPPQPPEGTEEEKGED